MKSGTCKDVPDAIYDELNRKERKYLEECWREGQKRRLEEAKRAGTCTPLLELPGIYPIVTATERVRIYACWLSEGYLVHDAALGAADVPDESLIPGLLKGLDLYPPDKNGRMICTTGHIVHALERISSRKCGNSADDWRKCLADASRQ